MSDKDDERITERPAIGDRITDQEGRSWLVKDEAAIGNSFLLEGADGDRRVTSWREIQDQWRLGGPGMTPDDVRKAVARIERLRDEKLGDDPITAHIEEDGLRADVLKTIADGAENPSELARIALMTGDLGFIRRHE